ncbi:hypothetical protein L6164_003559 [Bauhinia variegata]|uniref:Uncharacterized protein n=1 Tax=Bauhinia variegata TaxID=167791 RepID=A0ACB9Q369_BAUVA|nr:hypothetical protein L6164_003559 [Bauhinia variegata]
MLCPFQRLAFRYKLSFTNFSTRYVQAKLSTSGDEAWKEREAAVLALGAIGEVCINGLYPNLPQGPFGLIVIVSEVTLLSSVASLSKILHFRNQS